MELICYVFQINTTLFKCTWKKCNIIHRTVDEIEDHVREAHLGYVHNMILFIKYYYISKTSWQFVSDFQSWRPEICHHLGKSIPSSVISTFGAKKSDVCRGDRGPKFKSWVTFISNLFKDQTLSIYQKPVPMGSHPHPHSKPSTFFWWGGNNSKILNGLVEKCHAEKFRGLILNEKILFDIRIVKLFGVK